jgi:hypothetical protein
MRDAPAIIPSLLALGKGETKKIVGSWFLTRDQKVF